LLSIAAGATPTRDERIIVVVDRKAVGVVYLLNENRAEDISVSGRRDVGVRRWFFVFRDGVRKIGNLSDIFLNEATFQTANR
jgi:hypothetical protein